MSTSRSFPTRRHRSRVSDRRKNHVVLLGASRIQLGFATDTFRNKFPSYQITQLAIDGSNPVAALRDLANDEQFMGVVITSITAGSFRSGVVDIQQEYIELYHSQYSLQSSINALVQSFLQANLVVLNPRVRPDRVARSVLVGE